MKGTRDTRSCTHLVQFQSLFFISNNKKKTNPNPNDNDINEKEEANHELKIIRPTKDVLYIQSSSSLYEIIYKCPFHYVPFFHSYAYFRVVKVPDRQYNNKKIIEKYKSTVSFVRKFFFIRKMNLFFKWLG